MINGEPVFDARNEQSRQTDGMPHVDAQPQDITRSSNGQKIEPEVRVTRVKTTRNGDKMVSYAWVQNNSPFAVEVTKFYVMGQGVNTNCLLSPNQGREVKIYDGGVAHNDKEVHAYLDCKIAQNGDYFRQEFFVEFDRQSDGNYLIEELHIEEVRDI